MKKLHLVFSATLISCSMAHAMKRNNCSEKTDVMIAQKKNPHYNSGLITKPGQFGNLNVSINKIRSSHTIQQKTNNTTQLSSGHGKVASIRSRDSLSTAIGMVELSNLTGFHFLKPIPSIKINNTGRPLHRNSISRPKKSHSTLFLSPSYKRNLQKK